MIKQKLTRLQQNIIILLCEEIRNNLSQSEIAKKLSVSSSAIKKALPQLEKNNLIIKKQIKNIKLLNIELNRELESNINLKKAINIDQIYKSNLNEYLQEMHPGCTIILFGSYCRGEDTIYSDIDIAIIGTKKRKEYNLKKFEKKLNKEININTYDTLDNLGKELKANLFNGIILTGAIEL